MIIDTPFSTEEIDTAEAAWDRWHEEKGAAYDDPDIVNAIQQPFWEETAKQFLRAQGCVYWWTVGCHDRPPMAEPEEGYPSWEQEWAGACHTDIQLTRADWEATPRRNRCEVWWWLNDVPPERGAMRIMPGSMHHIMDHWSATLSPEQQAALPRVHGYAPLRGRNRDNERPFPEYLPDEEGGVPWTERKPAAAVAKRGPHPPFSPPSPARRQAEPVAPLLCAAETCGAAAETCVRTWAQGKR